MSLRNWKDNGWLKEHTTDLAELSNLLAIADRDIADAAADGLSNDWKFGIAYNAALKLCTMMLYDAGYMPEKALAHYRTLLSITFTLGEHRKDDATYLDACRTKRNHVEYDYVEGASAAGLPRHDAPALWSGKQSESGRKESPCAARDRRAEGG